MKLGFVYAGQGSQYVGMGKSLYEAFPSVRSFYDQLSLPVDIVNLSFNGPEERLNQTENTQPCMVALAIVMTDLLKESGIIPDYVAGLSLGEYSALYGSGALDQATTLDLITFRGQAMAQASLGVESKMLAILGLDKDLLQHCCDQASTQGVVAITNFNCPGQLVISGEKNAVEKAGQLALEAGARRCVALNTSGPFHTSLLKAAGDALHEKLKNIHWRKMNCPVIFNSTALPLKDDETIAELLEKQVQSPVLFEDSVRYMIEQGVDTIVEIGPGKVLSGFIRKIDRSIKCLQVEDAASLEKVITILKGEII